jgi:TRAP-type C4-dicarboxylate transport system permease small subunit
MKSFIRFADRINRALEVAVGLALAAMTGVIFLQVLVRFVFAPLDLPVRAPWTEELSRYLMIWAVFIGAALVARRAEALAVEALVSAVPPAAGRGIKVAAHVLSLFFYGCIFVIGLKMSQFGMTETAPVLKLPMVWIYASMSIGALLTIMNGVALLAEIWIEKKDILEVIDFELEEALGEVQTVMARKVEALT